MTRNEEQLQGFLARALRIHPVRDTGRRFMAVLRSEE